jgi:FkbM family methyltransferase
MFERTFVTYSQNGEDVMLWRALKDVRQGFYIDVGAQDPVHDSVTKAFYDRGWHGINIEPVAEWHERLVQDRPHDINLRLAASSHAGTIKLFEVEGSGLSTSDSDFAHRHEASGYVFREQVVECVTLDDICAHNRVGVVHFLKIDCEGSEKSVLEGISLSDVRPWIILVEATEPNSTKPTWHQWEHLLTGRGYRFMFFDGLNRYYLADEHAELASAFDAPVNVFDSARHLSEINAQKRLEDLQRQIDGLSGAAAVAKLQTRLNATQADLTAITAKYEAALAQRDAVVAERDAAAAGRDAAMSERDAAVTERDMAMAGRGAAMAERDAAVTKRDAAMSERDAAVAERDKAMAERDNLAVYRSALEREAAVREAKLTQLQEHVTALLSSHSWRVTMPLRVGSLAGRQVYGWLRSVLYVVLRPFAHIMRPVLRWLARNRSIRWCVTTIFGKQSHIVVHARLFLFGTAPHATSDTRMEYQDADPPAMQNKQRWPCEVLSERQLHSASSAEPFDLDEVMERVRAEVAHRRARES